MTTNMNRVMISIPADIKTEIECLKRARFCDKPYSEIYRQLIRLGLEKMADQDEKECTVQETAEI